MLSSLLTEGVDSIRIGELLMCISAAIVIGLLIAFIHMYRNTYTKNFVITLAVLPVLVQSVIMLVNGNLGAGIAVLGAFSLIRFRSIAGGSREITSIFWAMGAGLATGMGYISYIAIFSVIVAIFLLLIYRTDFGEQKSAERELKITIPEDLDYPGLFDEVLTDFAYSSRLDSVRTTTMGSLYELCYVLHLKDQKKEKKLIDAVRIRNGNLPVILGKVSANRNEL